MSSLKKYLEQQSSHENDDSGGHDWPFLVPMLDVVMILLFFFIIMSNSAQYVFDIKLPKPDDSYSNPATNLNPEKTLKIFIKKDRFMIDDKEYASFHEMKQQILDTTSGNKDFPITVASDRDVAVEVFLQLMTFLKSQQFNKVDILMKKD